jgi:hypothetical protein
LAPSLRATYRILRNGETVLEAVDNTGQSVEFFSEQRVILIARISLNRLEAGKYTIQVENQDRINNQSVTLDDQFQVKEG